MPKKSSNQVAFHIWGVPSAFTVALALTLDLASMFLVWAGRPGLYLYLSHRSLNWVRVLVQLAIIVGWTGVILHQFFDQKKRIACLPWMASCLSSFTALALTLDLKMNLHQGAYLCLVGGVLKALGILFEATKMEVILETEQNESQRVEPN